MSLCTCCGSICVSCLVGCGPAAGFRVTLTDSQGAVVCRQKTNDKGCVVFSIAYADKYCVRVESTGCYSPLAQRKWFHLSPENKCKCYFVFDKQCCLPKTGTLAITLRDAYYPQYTLSKGVYTLWQIF